MAKNKGNNRKRPQPQGARGNFIIYLLIALGVLYLFNAFSRLYLSHEDG